MRNSCSRNHIIAASLLLVCASCVPVIRHSSVPESLDRFDASRLGPSGEKVLALPMWRGHNSYFLGTPWVGTVATLPTLRSGLDVFHRAQLIDVIGQRYGGVPWIHGIYLVTASGNVVHLTVDWGRNPDKGWVVEARAKLGPAWRQQLLQQLSGNDDISLVGDYLPTSFWRFHNSYDCRPGAVHEDSHWADPAVYEAFVAEYCSTLRLRLPWSSEYHECATSFITAVSAANTPTPDAWEEVDEPIAAEIVPGKVP